MTMDLVRTLSWAWEGGAWQRINSDGRYAASLFFFATRRPACS